MTEKILITSLCIYAIHIVTGEGMILEWLKITINKRLLLQLDIDPEKLVKINKWLWDCPPCMASFWGTIAFLIIGLPMSYYLVFIFAVCGLNALIAKV